MLILGLIVIVLFNLMIFGWMLSDLFAGKTDEPEETEEITTEAPETEEPTTEEPTTEAPATEEPSTEEPTTEEPTTEEPTAEEPMTEAVVIEPGNIHTDETVDATDEIVQVIEMGKTVLADLDGDGVDEKITVRAEAEQINYYEDDIHFQIDELYYHGDNFDELICAGIISMRTFYLVDLDTSDRWVEIAIMEESCENNFLRYHEGGLFPIGEISGISITSGEDGSTKILGDGTISTRERYDVLQTSHITKTWRLLPSDTASTALEEVIPEYYEFELRPADWKMILKQDMTFFAELNGSMDNLITLPAGTEVDIARFYPDGEWIQILYKQDTKAVWLRRIGNNLIMPMNIFEGDMSEYIDRLYLAG